jgi:hypothetical protein
MRQVKLLRWNLELDNSSTARVEFRQVSEIVSGDASLK